MLIVKIQSISDVITNSSSEIFTIKTGGFSFDEVKELIETGAKARYEAYNKNWEKNCRKTWTQLEEDLDGCSGMGGDFSISSWEDIYYSHKNGILTILLKNLLNM